METHKLVHMANQIGDFFQAQADRDEAKAGIARHIRLYWAPSMRQELLTQLDQGAATGLSALVQEAVSEHRGRWV